jgi:CubicO group peptidase (beta-lactamase class C family)
MPDIDGLEMKTSVDEIIDRHPALGFALGVVRNGSLESFHGHCLADVASNMPVAEDTVFRVASITKTFTAIAVMQLWEQGLIDIDAPANDYLRAYHLIPANTGWRPAEAVGRRGTRPLNHGDPRPQAPQDTTPPDV